MSKCPNCKCGKQIPGQDGVAKQDKLDKLAKKSSKNTKKFLGELDKFEKDSRKSLSKSKIRAK